jgi:hypothetical protein
MTGIPDSARQPVEPQAAAAPPAAAAPVPQLVANAYMYLI